MICNITNLTNKHYNFIVYNFNVIIDYKIELDKKKKEKKYLEKISPKKEKIDGKKNKNKNNNF